MGHSFGVWVAWVVITVGKSSIGEWLDTVWLETA